METLQGKGRLEVLYFTDPYCSWCWSTEPMIKKMQVVYGPQIHIRYVMGGLVEDIANFRDTLNDISRLEQIGPHWAQVSQISGMPIDPNLWRDIQDPHFSTWPACIAYHAARIQGERAGDLYLRRLREAALTERKIISHRQVQLELAQEMGLNIPLFTDALDSGKAEQAFQRDLKDSRTNKATGFPTMLFFFYPEGYTPGQPLQGVVVKGHRSWSYYQEAMKRVMPSLQEQPVGELVGFLKRFPHSATREVAEVFGWSMEEAGERLSSLVKDGQVKEQTVANGSFWALAGKEA